jgi:hypothetical protein
MIPMNVQLALPNWGVDRIIDLWWQRFLRRTDRTALVLKQITPFGL